MNLQDKVKDFHERFGLTVSERPTQVNWLDAQLRCELIYEECKEFAEASGFNIANGRIVSTEEGQNLVGIADAIADLLYVVYGAAVTYGIDADKIFEEVHRSNLSKMNADGSVTRREDGKVLKPSTYRPPRIQELLR